MDILVILVPVSLALAGLWLGAFLWSLKAKQYDDLEGDAWRILLEDETARPEPEPGADPAPDPGQKAAASTEAGADSGDAPKARE